MVHEFESKLFRLDSKVYGHYVEVPHDIADDFHDKKIKRIMANFNKTVEVHCSINSSKDGFKFINLNKDLQKQLRVKPGDSILVSIREDTSKYGMHIPPEFEELLIQDIEGEKHFHRLTPGKQRTLIHMTAQAKSSDIRLRKAITILDYLKQTQGKLDFKELHLALKVDK